MHATWKSTSSNEHRQLRKRNQAAMIASLPGHKVSATGLKFFRASGSVITSTSPTCQSSQNCRKFLPSRQRNRVEYFKRRSPPSFLVLSSRIGGVCSPLVIRFFLLGFFQVTCDDRCPMPTLWRNQSVRCCVLRNLRCSAGRSTTSRSRTRFAATLAANRCNPAPSPKPHSSQPLFSAPRLLPSAGSRRQSNGRQHQVGSWVGHRRAVLLRTVHRNYRPFPREKRYG